MGLLLAGKWQNQPLVTANNGGKFIREDSQFRGVIGSEAYPAEADRYHLYISHACPWAHRTMIMRQLKQLQEILPVTVVGKVMRDQGWEFNEEPEPLYQKNYLYELYILAEPRYSGRVTVPVLWDKKSQTIVNNESAEIIRICNYAFNGLTGNQDDYYPVELQKEIDTINAFVYSRINNGVYKAGFATNQEAYEEAVTALFNALDDIDKRLQIQRYLVGNQLTEADIRLFTTLLRFDPVYVGHFKCNMRRIEDYTALPHYLRDIYQYPGVKETVHMDHIKGHYYQSHRQINPSGIVAKGPIIDLESPHLRDYL